MFRSAIVVALLALATLTGCAQLQGVLASATAPAKTQVAESTTASGSIESTILSATNSTIVFALDPLSEAATISNDRDVEEVLQFTTATSGNPATPPSITIQWRSTAPDELVLAAQLDKSDGKHLIGTVDREKKRIEFVDPAFFTSPTDTKATYTLLVQVDIKLITDTAKKIAFDIIEVEHGTEVEVRGIPLEGRPVHVRMTTFSWNFN